MMYTVPLFFEEELDICKEKYKVETEFRDKYIVITVVPNKPVDNDNDKSNDMK